MVDQNPPAMYPPENTLGVPTDGGDGATRTRPSRSGQGVNGDPLRRALYVSEPILTGRRIWSSSKKSWSSGLIDAPGLVPDRSPDTSSAAGSTPAKSSRHDNESGGLMQRLNAGPEPEDDLPIPTKAEDMMDPFVHARSTEYLARLWGAGGLPSIQGHSLAPAGKIYRL